LRNSASRWFLI